MKSFKHYFRKIPPLRWLDDFTDTQLGENVTFALVFLFLILLIVYTTGGRK